VPTPVSSTGEEIEPYSPHPSELRPYEVCPPPTKARPSCAAVGIPNPRKLAIRDLPVPSYEGSGKAGGFSPADLRSAYKLPSEGGEGQTVAITIAYDNPKAESDLAVYRAQYGLPACTTANGCFKKVNQLGEEGNYPAPNAEWAAETSLDLDMVSAICPKCHILLVEAKDNEGSNLYVAVEEAAKLGATVISDSWAGSEYWEETADDHYFNQAGIPILFASGDWGYGVYYPAASPNAIAVGGTTLKKAGNSRGWTESAWSGAGSGCSLYEAKPAWQKDEGCAKRTVADVSAVSDPATPVSVYDSYEYPGWTLFGGTSVATPLLAGVEALSTSAVRLTGPSAFTRIGQGGLLFDPVGGENGDCATYLCQGVVGYDGPTGWGTPNGTLALPVAVTERVSIESTAKATLRGSVRPGGVETKYRFEYGGTASYGTSVPVPDASAGSGSEYVEVSRAIEGLKGKATYHYRIVATQAGKTYNGLDRTFVTTPPSATTGAAGGAGIYHTTIGATVNPEGAASTYWFEYGTTAAYGSKAPLPAKELAAGTSNVEVGTPLEGLNGNKTYHYRIVAKNVAGTTYGADKTFATLPAEWRSRKLPEPEESTKSSAFAVSCVNAGDCTAVGNYYRLEGYNTQVTLAEHWNGSNWSPMSTPNPSGLEEGWKYNHWAKLSDVSCASSTDCVSVGKYQNTGEVLEPLSQHWNGTKWEEVAVPKPSGATEVRLSGVSCASATYCEATGSYVNSSGVKVTLAERWSGSKWEIQSTPSPSGATENVLVSVSCSSSSECTAAGSYKNSSGVTKPLVERWNGSVWAEQSAPSPAGSSNTYLTGVSCPAANACEAVGSSWLGSVPLAFAERWNGSSWSEQSTPALSEGGQLFDVSCTAASACVAAGKYYALGEGLPLLERWNGSAWSVAETRPPSVPAGWHEAGWPLGISCVESLCVAAGEIDSWPEGGFISVNAFVMQTAVAPSASTDPASEITETAATLNGRTLLSDPEEHCFGEQAECYFEYGQTTSYGNTAKGLDIFGFGQNLAFVKELVPGTTYHFRFVASDEAGTSYGEDVEFTTEADPAILAFASAFGSSGTGNGQFSNPKGIAIDASGNLWVADYLNNRVQKFNSKGEYLSQFGSSGSGNGQFSNPRGGIAIDASGNLWVIDTSNNRLQKFNSKGEYLSQFGSAGSGNGQFSKPIDVAIDSEGNLWVLQQSSPRVQKFNSKGEYLSQFGSSGSGNGQFSNPSGIAIDASGNLWVADSGHHRLQKFNSKGEYLTQFGSYGSGNGQLNNPSEIAIDTAGDLWVTDTNNNRVQVFAPTGKYLGKFGAEGSGSGQLKSPSYLAIDSAGNIWVTDSGNNRVEEWVY
jgi:sugar lactone lactonase YvrE